ncbi:MAG: T9SS type A sorting domain-containing protein, partial [Pseudomonadota bacterium]
MEFIHATQNNNQYIISGSTTYNDVSSPAGLFRINADGTLDSSFDVTAYTLGDTRDIAELSNGQIYIGGFFSLGAGNGLSPILRLNNDGSLDTTFNTTDIMFSTNTMGEVNAIEVQADEKVIIGGRFIEIEGRTIRGVARLNSDGSLDDTFNPEVPAQDLETYAGLNDQSLTQIYDMYLESSGRLIIAGNFGTYNGVVKMPLMAVFADAPLTLSTPSFDESFKSVKVYPNPAYEAFNISSVSNINKVEIIDYSGKLLQTYNNIASSKFTVSTEHLAKGMYVLKISTQDSIITK